LKYINMFNVFCNSKYCNYFDDGEFLFTDGFHLSYMGSKNLVDNSYLSSFFNQN